MVEVRDVSHRVGAATILEGVSVAFRSGRFNVILGPNGAGKSTLLRVASGLLLPTGGDVWYDDQPLSSIPVERLARTRAVLPQHVELALPLAVRDVVLMGRYPHYGSAPRPADREIVEHTLDLVGMATRAAQSYDTLSGGEQQKVQLARVLAQIWRAGDGTAQRRVLFLDEPTTNLDVHHQLWLLDLTRELVAHDCTVIAILHDLNVALEYGEHFVLLDAGRVALEAAHADDIPQEVVERVFRVRARRISTGTADRPYWRFSI
jgi:iron complex transport system ATP-binding protein